MDDTPDVAALGDALADAVEQALPAWVRRCVAARSGGGSAHEDEAAAAGAAAVDELMPELRSMLRADVDARRGNPLAVLRRAVLYPTAVLVRAGVAPVVRADDEARRFPDDLYALVPATWSDIDDSLAEPGLRWSAAVAWAHRARHRSDRPTTG